MTLFARAALAALLVLPAAAQADTFRGCGWYVVEGCRSASGSRPSGWILTNDYPNFRNGFYCRVEGPFGSSSKANEIKTIALEEGAPSDTYIKKGC